ncbi:MAG: ImuA family protein [Bacteroidia bacterium]
MKREADKIVIEDLQRQIMQLQGNRPVPDHQSNLSLGAIESSFPGNIFPKAAIHELISLSAENAACTSGFISVILGKLLQQNGFCAWIGTPQIYPPALKIFNIEPERILFINTKKRKDTLWALEETLKCDALTAVVGELSDLSFDESRRLQLAVERSRVTGFIHRHQPKISNPVACISRWKITSIPGTAPDGIPGLSFPAWNIELLKVRNGKPGQWQVQWSAKGLEYISKEAPAAIPMYRPQTA